jgi:hypothetical protein
MANSVSLSFLVFSSKYGDVTRHMWYSDLNTSSQTCILWFFKSD